jgi:hypothetical protein
LREPLYVLGVPLFSLEVFSVSPFVFLGCIFFHRRFFYVSPFTFWGCLFFIGGLLHESMNEGSYNGPLFMAPMFCVKCLSNFQLTLLAVLTLL